MTTAVGSNASSLVDVGDFSIAYRAVGAGPTVVFLHGCPFASFVWRDVMAGLAGRFRCVAPDLLGIGDTETPDGADWSLGAQAQMVIGFLDRLGIDRAHIVGHDHGGAVAQLLAANLADADRRAKTKRFLAGQLDPDHNEVTLDLVDGLRRFDHRTLLLWAVNDAHFGPAWADRLRADLAGPVEVRLLDDTGHLLMEERPGAYAQHVAAFLTAP